MKTILVIDDDAMIQRMAGFMLKKLGFTAITVGSGDEGISLLRSESPALVLLDVEMPGKDGFAVLEELRSDAALQSTKVCLMTGTLTDEIREKAKALECCACLHKPLTAPELQRTLEAFAD